MQPAEESTDTSRALFRRRLKESREKLGMNQAELAAKAGLTPSAISQFEAGDREPNFGSLVKLAKSLEVSPSYLSGTEEYDLDPAMRAFYREHQELSEQDVQLLRTMAMSLKNYKKT